MSVIVAVFWFVVAVIWAALSTPEAGGPGVRVTPEKFDAENVPLAVVFVGWYGHDPVTGECVGGLYSAHWNNDPDTGGVLYVPEIGYYCSSDPDVVAWQLDQMLKAGIKVVVYSWWGNGDTNLDGVIDGHPDQFINKSLTKMLNQIRAKDLDIEVAILVEPFTVTQAGGSGELSSRQSQMVLDYLWENYYGKYPDQMFEWQGKPLVVTFDPMQLMSDERFTIKKWTGRAVDEVTIKEGWDWSFEPLQSLWSGLSKDGVVFVYPRFDETALDGAGYLTWEPRKVDPDLTDKIYEKQWEELVHLRRYVTMIILYSWNVYGEQAHIEPSNGGPAPVGYAFVESTRRYIDKFQDVE